MSMPPPGASDPTPLPPPWSAPPPVEDDRWSTTRIGATPPDRDHTPPYVRRMRSRRERAAAARPARRRAGPSAGVIAGVIVPILFLVIGTGFIAAALEADDEPDVVLEPPAALGEGEVPVNETAPPPMVAPPPTTAAPVPDTTIAPETTLPPVTSLPPETTLAPDSTVPPETTAPSGATSPEVAQAVAIADAYLAAIVRGDYATALQLGRPGLTEAELVDAFPGIVRGRAELIAGGPPGPSGVPLRLLLVTEHELEGEPDAAVTCVRWDVNAGIVTEVFKQELNRTPGTMPEPQLVQARIDCAVIPVG